MNTEPIRYHAFISYARKDGISQAARLQEALEKRGFNIWRDPHIDPRENFIYEIQKAIAESQHVIVCVTADVQRSDSFVTNEALYAQLVQKPIVVAQFDDVIPPINIITRTWLKFTSNWDQEFEKLCALLQGTWNPGSSEVSTHGNWSFPPPKSDPHRAYVESFHEQLSAELRQNVFSTIIPLSGQLARPRVLPTNLTARGLKVGGGNDQPAEPIANLDEAFARSGGRMMLLGEAGGGKTITLLNMAVNAAAARLTDPRQPLPVFASIPTWLNSGQLPFMEWIAKQTQRLINQQVLRREIQTGNIVFFLDGLDELGERRPIDLSDPQAGEFDPRLDFLRILPPNNAIVITCRAKDYEDIRLQSPITNTITLERLTETQVREYLSDLPELQQALDQEPELLEIARTPLLLALFRMGFVGLPEELKKLHTLSQIEIRGRIFDVFINRRYGWEHERSKLPFTLHSLREVLSAHAVSNAMMIANPGVISLKTLREKGVSENAVLANKVFLDRAVLLNLLVPLPDETYRFIHLGLRDHLAAPKLMRMLFESEPDRQTVAAMALAPMRDTRAIDPLIQILNRPPRSDLTNMFTIAAAQGALLRIGQPAVPALRTALRSSSEHIRAGVATVLSQMAEQGIECLIEALHDSDRGVRQQAIHSLGHAGVIEPLVDVLHVYDETDRTTVASQLTFCGQTGLRYLIAALGDSNEDVVKAAAAALINLKYDISGMFNTGKDGEFLEEAVNEVLRQHSEALQAAIELLIEAMQTSDGRVRVWVGAVLAGIGIPALEPVIGLLDHTDEDVVASAIGAIGAMGLQAVDWLIDGLRKPRNDIKRSRIAGILAGGIGIPAVPFLVPLLADLDGEVVTFVIWILNHIGTPALPYLIAALGDENRGVAISAGVVLAGFGEASVQPLIDAMSNGAPLVRNHAAEVLIRIGTPEAIEAAERYKTQQ